MLPPHGGAARASAGCHAEQLPTLRAPTCTWPCRGAGSRDEPHPPRMLPREAEQLAPALGRPVRGGVHGSALHARARVCAISVVRPRLAHCASTGGWGPRRAMALVHGQALQKHAAPMLRGMPVTAAGAGAARTRRAMQTKAMTTRRLGGAPGMAPCRTGRARPACSPTRLRGSTRRSPGGRTRRTHGGGTRRARPARRPARLRGRPRREPGSRHRTTRGRTRPTRGGTGRARPARPSRPGAAACAPRARSPPPPARAAARAPLCPASRLRNRRPRSGTQSVRLGTGQPGWACTACVPGWCSAGGVGLC